MWLRREATPAPPGGKWGCSGGWQCQRAERECLHPCHSQAREKWVGAGGTPGWGLGVGPTLTSCFPFMRQMLMSCWFDFHVSFWEGNKWQQ